MCVCTLLHVDTHMFSFFSCVPIAMYAAAAMELCNVWLLENISLQRGAVLECTFAENA